MSILHGSWLIKPNNKYLFIWGENWQTLGKEKFDLDSKDIYDYPFCLNQDSDLLSFLKNHHIDLSSMVSKKVDFNENWQSESILLPTQKRPKSKTVLPLLSKQILDQEINISSIILYPWKVQGLCLNKTEAVKFLSTIPLKEKQYLGADIKFLSHIYRWSLDLICRHKFLPNLTENNQSYWQPLLDSTIAQTLLAQFVQDFPPVCRSYEKEEDLKHNLIEPQEIILDFLANILDSQIRSFLDISIPPNPNLIIQPWLQSLQQENGIFKLKEQESKRLITALDNWTLPIQENLVTDNNKLGEKQYRTCFKLIPPSQGSINWGEQNWELIYGIQALDDPNFFISANEIWEEDKEEIIINSRSIENPQEILLKGLGLASHLYEPIAESLEESTPVLCIFNPIQVYEFIRSIAWQLQDKGCGVILPKGLGIDKDEKRLGVTIEAQVTEKKGERLSLQSLLKYNLKVAVGDKKLLKKEFENLLEQKSPIVEIDGEWLALQPADVKAAQDIFDKGNSQLKLTVEDALKLSSGNNDTIEKLPLIGFETSGILSELINNLNNNQKLKTIPTPSQFKGTLRPYQKHGFSWLSFLEKWNFGACLADDMGLGKTIQLIAFLTNLKKEKMLVSPVLIVCPTSVINNWQREIQKFAPILKTMIYHGEQRPKNKDFLKTVKKEELVITSYGLIYRDLATLKQIMAGYCLR